MKKIKVCHLTTAHSSHDIRILKKECVSLANNGFDVTLIAPNCKEEVIEGVNIQSLNIKVTGRFSRFFKVAKKLYEKALVLNADIYHFHDPDFMFYGVKLIRKNKKVIYDIHEDYPLNILEKHWIPKILRPLVSFIYSEIEKYSIKKYTALMVEQAYISTLLNKRLDSSLSVHGLSFTEFVILHKLYTAEGGAQSRIGLADSVGLTASGVTRLLAPMTKNNITIKIINSKFKNPLVLFFRCCSCWIRSSNWTKYYKSS